MQKQLPYTHFVKEAFDKTPSGEPIFVHDVADVISQERGLAHKQALAAACCAFKRFSERNEGKNLRRWKKGIYYKTTSTLLVKETPIRVEKVFSRLYVAGGNGYETGEGFVNKIGLSTWIPAVRTFVTNNTKRTQANLDWLPGYKVVPSQVVITQENRLYLQLLDILDNWDSYPIDDTNPCKTIARYIKRAKLDYRMLLRLGEEHYSGRCINRLCHVACFELEDERQLPTP